MKQPLMRWSNLEEVKSFGEGILGFYYHRQRMLHEADRKKAEEESSVADELLRLALGDDSEGCDQSG
jgi:hypothetical protein